MMDREEIEEAIDEISADWQSFWHMNVAGVDGKPAPDLPLARALTIFIAEQIHIHGIEAEDVTGMQYITPIIMLAVRRAKTHSDAALDAAFDDVGKPVRTGRFQRIPRRYRALLAGSVLWVLGVLLYAIFFQHFGDFDDRDLRRVISTAFIPPAFVGFAFWLIKKAMA